MGFISITRKYLEWVVSKSAGTSVQKSKQSTRNHRYESRESGIEDGYAHRRNKTRHGFQRAHCQTPALGETSLAPTQKTPPTIRARESEQSKPPLLFEASQPDYVEVGLVRPSAPRVRTVSDQRHSSPSACISSTSPEPKANAVSLPTNKQGPDCSGPCDARLWRIRSYRAVVRRGRPDGAPSSQLRSARRWPLQVP